MEAEIRLILTEAVSEPDEYRGLLVTVRDRFSEIGGVDLDLPDRTLAARAPEFGS